MRRFSQFGFLPVQGHFEFLPGFSGLSLRPVLALYHLQTEWARPLLIGSVKSAMWLKSTWTWKTEFWVHVSEQVLQPFWTSVFSSATRSIIWPELRSWVRGLRARIWTKERWTLWSAVPMNVPHSDYYLIKSWSWSLAPIQATKLSLRRIRHFPGKAPTLSKGFASWEKRSPGREHWAWHCGACPACRPEILLCVRRICAVCPSHHRWTAELHMAQSNADGSTVCVTAHFLDSLRDRGCCLDQAAQHTIWLSPWHSVNLSHGTRCQ